MAAWKNITLLLLGTASIVSLTLLSFLLFRAEIYIRVDRSSFWNMAVYRQEKLLSTADLAFSAEKNKVGVYVWGPFDKLVLTQEDGGKVVHFGRIRIENLWGAVLKLFNPELLAKETGLKGFKLQGYNRKSAEFRVERSHPQIVLQKGISQVVSRAGKLLAFYLGVLSFIVVLYLLRRKAAGYCEYLWNKGEAVLGKFDFSDKWLWGVIFVAAALFEPRFPGAELDPSWVLGLNIKDYLFGRDIVFTYGPMHYAIIPLIWHAGQNVWPLFGAVYVLNWVFLASLLLVLQRFNVSAVCKLLMLLLGWMIAAFCFRDYLIPLALIDFLLLICVDTRRGIKVFSAAAVIVLGGVAGLVKFNVLAAVCGIMLIAWLGCRRKKNAVYLVIMSLGIPVVAAGLWLLHGQDLRLAGAYLRQAYDLLSYHDSAMNITVPVWLFWGVITAAVFAVVNGRLVYRLWRDGSWRDCPYQLLLLELPVWFVLFKHGWVRNDGHIMIFIYGGSFLTMMNLLAAGRKRCCMLLLALVVFAGTEMRGVIRGGRAAQAWSEVLRGDYTLPEGRKTMVRRRYALEPKTIAKIGKDSIDVFPWDIAVLYANDLNWQPRPMMQSYLAVSPELDRRNAEAVSGNGPKWILFKYLSIDQRYPLFDEPLTKIKLLENYRTEKVLREFVLMKKADKAVPFTEKVLSEGEFAAGEYIEIPKTVPGNLVVAEFEPEFNWLGRIANFFFKPNETYIRFADEKGESRKYKTMRGSFPNGVIVNRRVESNEDWLKFLDGKSDELIENKAFKVLAPLTFKQKIKVKFKELSR